MARVRERLARYPPFGFLARVKAGIELMRLTTTPWRFLLGQVTARQGVSIYTMCREGSPLVALRHGTADVATLHQIFLEETHGETPEAAAAIAALGAGPRVLDIGANVGAWSAWAVGRWPGALVTGVEADPANVGVLQAAAEANGGWRVVAAAAGVRAGTLRFVSGHHGTSHAATADETGSDVIEVPMIDIFDLARQHDVIKLDIEGGEWDILGDGRLADLDVAAILLEYHARWCPSADTHAQAESLLRAAGFEMRRIPHVAGAPPEEGVVWAWRPGAAS